MPLEPKKPTPDSTIPIVWCCKSCKKMTFAHRFNCDSCGEHRPHG